MDLKIFSTSARLQHAQNQYESLLIRAGEIIEHVPNPANMHNMNYNNNANQFHSDAGGLDTSYDSVEETYSVNGNGCYEHSTITHRHTQQWHGAGNEAEPGAGPDVDIGMRQQPSVRFDFSGKIPAAGLISPSGLGIGSVGGIGSNYSSRTASPTISSSSGGVGGAYVPTTTTSPSSSHTPLPKPPPVPMPAFARNDSDGFALSVEEDEKLTIIITLQAEVHRLKNKLETTITSAEETIGDLYQAHVSVVEQVM